MGELGLWQARPEQVVAIQYDGSPSGAHKVLAWVFGIGHTGEFDYERGILKVVGNSIIVNVDCWVVLRQTGRLDVFEDRIFTQFFEPRKDRPEVMNKCAELVMLVSQAREEGWYEEDPRWDAVDKLLRELKGGVDDRPTESSGNSGDRLLDSGAASSDSAGNRGENLPVDAGT